jgi:hypothetical protein
MKNGNTFSEKMSIALKISKMNIQFNCADVFITILFVYKRFLNQCDVAVVEKQQ